MPQKSKQSEEKFQKALKIARVALSKGEDSTVEDLVQALRFKSGPLPSSQHTISSCFYKVTLQEKQTGEGGNISLKVRFEDAHGQKTVAAMNISDDLNSIKSVSSIKELCDVRIRDLKLP